MRQRESTFTSRRDEILPRARRRRRSRGTTRSVVLVAILVAVAAADFAAPQSSAPGGNFIVQCAGPVLSQPVDPITRLPSHNHEFYGSRAIGLNATYQELQSGSSACQTRGDTASYWAPTLYVAGNRLPVPKSTFYYNAGEKRLPLTAWPAHLKMLAGDPHAMSPQSTSVVYWGCGDGSSVSKVNAPAQCRPGDTGLTMHVIFPDCWNGRDTNSPDHKSHMAYSKGGTCPAGYPVSLPRLIARFQWANQYPSPTSVTLSSGSAYPLHVCFWK